jgi:two-component system, OmpR family, phosphate regulon response regulator PhoB
MTTRTATERRATSNAASASPTERRRVLLFDGNDQSIASAAPALNGLGIEVVHADLRSAPIGPSARNALAVVVAATNGDGRETTHLVRYLREVSALPVLLLAARAQEDVLLQEFQANNGNSSLLVPLELAQQIRAILRRAPSRVLRFGLLEIDTASREVRVGRQAIELSRREFDLIEYLASAPGQVFTRRELLNAVWHSSGEWQTPSTVTEHVRRIRSKLQTRPEVPNWLVTVRGTGYRFQE